MLENVSHSIRTAASAVHATKADTYAEFEITNRDYGTWSFDITGHGGTANISVELTGEDPADIIKQLIMLTLVLQHLNLLQIQKINLMVVKKVL